MRVVLKIKNAVKDIIISNESSLSSYGIPVAIVDGIAYGKNDELPIWPDDELSFLHEEAGHTIAAAIAAINDNDLKEDQKEFCRKFYS